MSSNSTLRAALALVCALFAAPALGQSFTRSTIGTDASTIYRDYNTDGVPSTGYHDPKKSDIRSRFGVIDGALNTIELSQIAPIAADTVLCNSIGSSATPTACTTPPSGLTIDQPTITNGSWALMGKGSISTRVLNFDQNFSESVSANFAPFEIQMSDAIAAGTNFVYPMAIYETLNSASVTGNRPGFTSQITISHATGNSGGEYLAGSFFAAAGANDKRTSGKAAGFLNGLNPKALAFSGATYWAGVIGSVTDAGATGASAGRRIGSQIEATIPAPGSDGGIQGSVIDAGIDFDLEGGSPAPAAWNIGILLDNSTGVNAESGGTLPIAANGTLIKGAFYADSTTLHAGLDLSLNQGAWATVGGLAVDAIILPNSPDGTLQEGITWSTSGAQVYSTATNGGGGGTVVLANGRTSLIAGGITVSVDSNGFGFDYAGTTTCTVTGSVPVTINGSMHKIPYC